MTQDAVHTLADDSLNVSRSNDTGNPFDDAENVTVKTLTFPANVQVPIIASLPSLHSSDSSISPIASSSTNNTSSTSTHITDVTPTPIQWTAADLRMSPIPLYLHYPFHPKQLIDYLLSILYPDANSQNRLIYTPPLESLHTHPFPIHLRAFIQTPEPPIPPEAFSQHAPIGTGRRVTRVLVAESSTDCQSPAAARTSLAKSVLSRWTEVDAICAKYTVLSALYSLSGPALESVSRGMKAMAQAGATERRVRLWQLQGVVDGLCEFDLRLETFLLEAGSVELECWIQCVEAGLGLRMEVRERWAEVYGDAGNFLREAYAG
jgi:hypothetical protein